MSMSKLQELAIQMHFPNEFMPAEYYRDIFHYTSPEGFRSILLGSPKSVTIWASRYDCLNDASEGTIAEQVFLETCADLKEQGHIDDNLYQLFVKVHPEKTTLIKYREDAAIRLTRLECDKFVCSFSKNPDSLAMWNYYSKGHKYEGFNIGFLTSRITDSLYSVLRVLQFGGAFLVLLLIGSQNGIVGMWGNHFTLKFHAVFSFPCLPGRYKSITLNKLVALSGESLRLNRGHGAIICHVALEIFINVQNHLITYSNASFLQSAACCIYLLYRQCINH